LNPAEYSSDSFWLSIHRHTSNRCVSSQHVGKTCTLDLSMEEKLATANLRHAWTFHLIFSVKKNIWYTRTFFRLMKLKILDYIMLLIK